MQPCPKCRGQMFLERVALGKFELACLQCGYRRGVVLTQPQQKVKPEGPVTLSEYVTKKKYLEKLGSRRV